jgi:LacI family transcriptional regulator
VDLSTSRHFEPRGVGWAQPIALTPPREGDRLVQQVTLQDLADTLGVARSTVSRALRGDRQISEATRRRVEHLARRLGYHPNAAARALTHRAAGAVGLILPRSSRFVFANPYFAALLDGISAVAEAEGYPMLLSTSPAPDYGRWLGEGRVDGLITLGSSLGDPDLERLEALVAGGAAIVVIGEPPRPAEIAVVTCDELPGIDQACAHLASLGHERVAVVTGPPHASYARSRQLAWQAAARAHGLEVVRTVPGDDTFAAGHDAASGLLAGAVDASAWLFGNDLMAFGALQALDAIAAEAPDRVSVIGFDDVSPADLLGLSTVHQPIRDLGSLAMQALAANLRGQSTPAGRLVTHFEARRTSAAPPRAAPATDRGQLAGSHSADRTPGGTAGRRR